MLGLMVTNLFQHGRIRTTLAKAKVTQRLGDRLITLGKEGSIHSRRMAYRVLKDRDAVKQLFGEIAPRFVDTAGGYTRVLKLGPRQGDGAPVALLELTRQPLETPKAAPKAKAQPTVSPKPTDAAKPQAEQEAAKPKRFFEGVRDLFRPKKGAPVS